MKHKGWMDVVDTLGKLNNELKERIKQKDGNKYESAVNTTSVITKEKKILLLTFL